MQSLQINGVLVKRRGSEQVLGRLFKYGEGAFKEVYGINTNELGLKGLVFIRRKNGSPIAERGKLRHDKTAQTSDPNWAVALKGIKFNPRKLYKISLNKLTFSKMMAMQH